MVVGEQQEAGAEGTEGLGLPAEGDAAPESQGAPEESGEGAAGEGAGEGEGSEKKGAAWTKDKADITRLQQEKAEQATEIAELKRARLGDAARQELARRRASEPQAKAEPTLSDEDEATYGAIDKLVKKKTGKSLSDLIDGQSSLAGNVRNADISAIDAEMRANPDRYPHYADFREVLLEHAANSPQMTRDGFKYAYSELEGPRRVEASKSRRAAKAKATTTKRDAINGAPLPGGGNAGGGSAGDRVISREDLGDPSKVSDADLERMMDEQQLEL